MFFKKKEVKDQAKKFDKLITGLIIGGAVASMIGLSKTNKGKEVTENVKSSSNNFFKKGYKIFGKVLLGGIKIFTKK
ncbi:MAG: hypothetical protein PHS49_04620 [Candidatus Gracilibacteria bacterium]|nr:hypothetical protein [Candidatus Gracilibacteria bacterium]